MYPTKESSDDPPPQTCLRPSHASRSPSTSDPHGTSTRSSPTLRGSDPAGEAEGCLRGGADRTASLPRRVSADDSNRDGGGKSHRVWALHHGREDVHEVAECRDHGGSDRSLPHDSRGQGRRTGGGAVR